MKKITLRDVWFALLLVYIIGGGVCFAIAIWRIP